MSDVDYIALAPMPRGWPIDSFRPEMRRGEDFIEAFHGDGGVWVKMLDGSRYVIPLAHVLVLVPREWP